MSQPRRPWVLIRFALVVQVAGIGFLLYEGQIIPALIASLAWGTVDALAWTRS